MEFLKRYLIAKDVYFYTLSPFDGSVELHKGDIYQDDITKRCSQRKAFYKECEKTKEGTVRETCVEEGVFWRNTVWLKERDDKRAFLLFFQYFDDMISKKEKDLRNIIKRAEKIKTTKIKLCFKEN